MSESCIVLVGVGGLPQLCDCWSTAEERSPPVAAGSRSLTPEQTRWWWRHRWRHCQVYNSCCMLYWLCLLFHFRL